jgi:hypothetical protein
MLLGEVSGDLGFESVPGVAGTFSGRAIVCGSGRCLWDDLKAVGEIQADYVAVKQAGLYLPFRFKHWANAHGERFQWMVPLRHEGYYFRGMDNGHRGVHPQKLGAILHAEKSWPLVDHVWPTRMTGTSALFAVRVALALGYEEVILCGVPLDTSGRFYAAPWDRGIDLNVVDMKEWEAYVPAFDGRVKSMSGRTRELLGGPNGY